MADGNKKELPDWVLPTHIHLDPKKLSLEDLEKLHEGGFQIENDPDKSTTTITGRVIVKGTKSS